MVDGTGVVQLAQPLGDAQGIKLAPALVEGHPQAQRHAVIEGLHRLIQIGLKLQPACRIAAAHPRILPVVLEMDAHKRQILLGHGDEVLAAAHHVLPDDHAKAVTVIVPAHRLNFDVLAQHVEAQVLHGLDVPDHGLVAGRGIEAVGPVALVKKAMLEIGLIVQSQHLAALVLHDGELAHAEIALHMVAAENIDLQRIEEGILRTPGTEMFLANQRPAGAVILCPVLGNALAVLTNHHMCPDGVGGMDLPQQLAVIKIRSQLDGGNVVVRHTFHPHRLPDAALGSVPNAATVIALLAVGVGTAVGLVGDGHGQAVLAVHQRLGDIKGEGQIAALMAAHFGVVDQHAAALIHRAEVEDHPVLPESLRQGEGALIPQRFAALELEVAAGEETLGREGHHDSAGVIFGILLAVLHGVIPDAIQIEVALTLELRPGIFRQGAAFVQIFAPGGVKVSHLTLRSFQQLLFFSAIPPVPPAVTTQRRQPKRSRLWAPV